MRENKEQRNPCQYIVELSTKILSLKELGFQESYRNEQIPQNVVFTSKKCKINISWEMGDYLSGNAMHVSYGRKHAIDDKGIINWKGVDCWCWHRIELPLHFLDGQSLDYAAKHIYTHKIKRNFNNDEGNTEIKQNQPEWILTIHSLFLKEYSEKLFDLFDMTNEEIWLEYQKYVKAVYPLTGRSFPMYPPPWSIC